ncbi:MAG: hypothetical protein WCK01_00045 [Candidatus Uhrbacteria bacterium]
MKNVLAIVLAFVSSLVAGCGDFGGYPQVAPVTGDAGPAVFGDAGPTPPTVDAGTVPQVDSGTPTPAVDSGITPSEPTEGAACDSDIDFGLTIPCQHADCTGPADLLCARNVWTCFVRDSSTCTVPTTPDAGAAAIDAGTDAGHTACAAGTVSVCELDCGHAGHIDCNASTGSYDGACLPYAGWECPAATVDAGIDSGVDAGSTSVDAGVDAYVPPPAVDAGHSVAMRTLSFDFNVDAVLLYSPSSMDFLEETALSGATHADARPVTCESGSGVVAVGGATWFRCILTRAVGTEFFFVGTFMTHASSTYGSSEAGVWASFSGWNPGGGSCGDLAATRGVAWAITETSGRSLLPASGIPEIVQPRGITEDGRRVCRGRMVF